MATKHQSPSDGYHPGLDGNAQAVIEQWDEALASADAMAAPGGEPERTGYSVNLAGRSRANVATLADLGMAQARARSEARSHRQATEVIDRQTRRVIYRVGYGKR